MAPLDLQDQSVLVAFLDYLEKMEKTEMTEQQGLQVLKDPMGLEDYLVCQDFQEQKAIADSKDWMEERVTKVQMVKRDLLVQEDLPVRLDLWGQPDPEANVVVRDLQVHQASVVLMVLQAHLGLQVALENLGLLDSQVQLVQKEIKVYKVPRVQSAFKDPEVNQESLVHLVNVVPWDLLAKMA